MLLSQITNPQSDYQITMAENSGGQGEEEIAATADSDNFMDSLELPDLDVEDVETVMSEHSTWTGDQIETFLKSLDIEELDCCSSLKSSLSGYESDSGYSTHEVSPLMGGSTHYSSALSPAITPVTPSPILSSSTSSPLPFCLYQDDAIFPQVHPVTPNATTPNTATSNSDHHFFGSTDIPLLSQGPQCSPPPDFLSSSSSSSPSICQQADGSQQPHFLSLNSSTKGCVQSVMPPISNIPDIEANRHSVTVVPNSYCNSPCPSTEIRTINSHSNIVINPQCTDSIPQFDNILDGYLNMLSTGNGDEQVNSNNNNQAFLNDNVSDRIQRQPSVEDQSDIRENDSRKPSCSVETMQQLADVNQANESSGRTLVSDSGRKVIAQVLSPPRQTQQQMASAGTVPSSHSNRSSSNSSSSSNGSSSGSGCRSSKVKGKGRHHSASVAMKGHQRGKKKNSWPKSMNSGNLLAFRNFILGKLKHNPAVSCSYTTSPSEHLSDVPMSHSVPPTPTYFSLPSDDIFSDIAFNPDTLLTSECSLDSACFSPFSHHSGSISPSPVPLSPGLESSMHFTSLSSLSSNPSPCPTSANLGIDGFIQCLPVDQVSQGFEQDFHPHHLADDFCSALKTDADPLLGGLS